MVVTASIVCVPLGGTLAGFFSGFVLYSIGWRPAFYIGGALPFALLVLLWFSLPESSRFLARHGSRRNELRRLLASLGRLVAGNAVFVEGTEQKAGKTGVAFVRYYRTGWPVIRLRSGLLFFCMLAVYAVFGWLPTILAAEQG